LLFNSYTFIFAFLPLCLVSFYIVKHFFGLKGSLICLIVFSLIFYSYWSINYLFLLLASVSANYLMSSKLSERDLNPLIKRYLFIFGIAFNIFLLGIFKYYDFFIVNINLFTGTELMIRNIVLPLAISFYTLQQITFLVDSGQGSQKKSTFIDYVIFVLFFPQLIAGPIVRYGVLKKQYLKDSFIKVDINNINLGISIFSIGLFKKVFLADYFAQIASWGFSDSIELSVIQAWLVSLSYVLQLYFDFSGYSDMAIGLGIMFGFTLPINFNSPLKSSNIIDFWNKWHMTLTSFIGAYLFTPMLRASKTPTFIKSLIFTIISMTIAGLWHGPSWLFVIFGLWHGLGLAINQLYRKFNFKMNYFLGWFLTINFWTIGCVFFRSEDTQTAFNILSSMYYGQLIIPSTIVNNLSHIGLGEYYRGGSIFEGMPVDPINYILMFIGGIVIIALPYNTNFITLNFKFSRLRAILFGAVFSIAILSLGGYSEFIYFNF